MTVDPESIGLCPATLLVEPMGCDGPGFEQLLRDTAAAGFSELSVWAFQALGADIDRVVPLLDDLGLRVCVSEAATGWTAGPGAALDADAEYACGFATAVGADMVAACTLEPTLDSTDAAIAGFTALCATAAERGQRVCLEFLPWTAIPDLASAWHIVRESGAANGGILLDTWHWQNQPGGPAFGVLQDVPGDRIHFVQVCDAAPTTGDDLFAEAMSARRLPGDGVVDFAGLFAALDDIGADPFYAYEVFSTELAGHGSEQMARELRHAGASALPG